jgi:predicted RND superfamily exporter protein
MTMRLVKTNSSKEEVEAMQTTRTDVADATDDEAGIFPFTFGFVFTEQYVVIELEAVQNLSLALGAALLVVMFMLGNLGLGALTFVCILFTIVDILGLMWAWGVAIDGVSVVNLVLAIGLAVDYSVHIAHGYAAAPHQLTRRERVHFSLATMGSSVFNGGVSTFIAVLVLAFSQSFIFIVFFKQFFGIVIFGLFHGLVFLPAILSLIGPQGSVLAEAYESHELKMHAEGDDSSESHTTSTSGETPPPGGEYESGSSSSESDSELSSEVA